MRNLFSPINRTLNLLKEWSANDAERRAQLRDGASDCPAFVRADMSAALAGFVKAGGPVLVAISEGARVPGATMSEQSSLQRKAEAQLAVLRRPNEDTIESAALAAIRSVAPIEFPESPAVDVTDRNKRAKNTEKVPDDIRRLSNLINYLDDYKCHESMGPFRSAVEELLPKAFAELERRIFANAEQRRKNLGLL